MQPCSSCNAANKDTANFCSVCGQRLAGALSAGQVLQGRYRITGLLGKGGMGAVYQAHDLRLGGRRVAVKENFDVSNEAKAQFEVEATTLANLNHPSLPRVNDHFIDASGKQYLVMDFVEGEDLQDMLDRQGRQAETQALPWFREVCDALVYMHDQNPPIIHRDIKPSNIKITPAGRAMLVDFGIAKHFRPGHKTVAAARAVSSGFSPPEQYGGGITDARSDVYALAATLYCLFTGQTPPDAMDRLSRDRLSPPRQLAPSISPATERAILKGMELHAGNRVQSIRDFRDLVGGQQAPAVAAPMLPAVAAASSQAPAAPLPAPFPPAPIRSPVPAPTGATYEFASFSRRLVATFIDSIVIQLLIIIPNALLTWIWDNFYFEYSTLSVLQFILFMIIMVAYFVYFYSRTGQTLGKRAVGIKVIATNGSIVSKQLAIARTTFYLIEIITMYILIGFLGFLWMAWDKKSQTWHDKAAKTYVISRAFRFSEKAGRMLA